MATSGRLRAHFARRSGRRQFATAFLSVFGLLWLILEPAGLFLPGDLDWGWPGYFALLATSLGAGLWRARPRDAIERALPPSDLRVSVRVGDLLDQRGSILIGVPDTFDTQLEDDVISARSVQGQLLQRVFHGDRAELDRLIHRAIGPGELDASKSYGKDRRHPIGTVAVVRRGDARYFLAAFTQMSSTPPAHVSSSVEWLQTALARSWEVIRIAGQREPVHAPVIGSHLARLGISRTLLIQIMVLSFIAASGKQSPSSSLTIWVSPQDAEIVDLVVLDAWLAGLCAA